MSDVRTNRSLVTPPVNTSGIYLTYHPFQVPDDVVYRCEAIRAFDELRAKGIDVYDEFYKPYGLSVNIYTEDANRGASIVTLVSAAEEFVYVPNTFIESYPGMSGIAYERKLLLLELGPLPSTMNVDYLLPEIKDLVIRGTGVVNDRVSTEFTTITQSNNITHSEHLQLEASRRVAIAQHKPLVEQLREMTLMKEALEKEVADLTEVIESLQDE